MYKHSGFGFAALSLGIIAIAAPAQTSTPKPGATDRLDKTVSPASAAKYLQLPLAFERQGTGTSERYVARGQGYTIGLAGGKATIGVVSGSKPGPRKPAEDATAKAISLEFTGGRTVKASLRAELPGKVNYIRGNDPRKWQLGISTYGQVAYQGVYPGIDVVYYGNQQQLEFDFVVKPGANPGAIRMKVRGASKLAVDASGGLDIGDLRVELPKIYQEVKGEKKAVRGHYALRGNDEVAFQVDSYDRRRALVIDPTIVYSTLLGGGTSSSYGMGIALDASNNIFVTGYTYAGDFPTVNAAQSGASVSADGFVTKINAAGTALVYSTYLGGSGFDYLQGIAVDQISGAAWVTGYTSSADFPLLNATQTTFSGSQDAIAVKLSASGALQFSTYFGGDSATYGYGIAVDSSENAYVGGYYYGSLPTTVSTLQGGAFVAKYGSTGTLIYSTAVGGGGTGGGSDYAYGIAVDGLGDAYLTGLSYSPTFSGAPSGGPQTTNNGGGDAFVAELNPAGTGLLYFTFLGGAALDEGYQIALDGSNNVYIAGYTGSTGLATTGAAQTSLRGAIDGFIAKLNLTASTFTYVTYLGGIRNDYVQGMAINGAGEVYVTGYTDSVDFPVVSALESALPGNNVSLFQSSNSAASFTASDGNIPGAVFDVSPDPLNAGTILVATEGGIYRTTNNGDSWTQQFNGQFYNYDGPILARSPVTPTTIYAAQYSQVYQSTDNGVTWTYMGNSPAGGAGIIADPLTTGTVYAFSSYGSAATSVVYRSTDGGATWNPAGTGLPAGSNNTAVQSVVATTDGSLYLAYYQSGIYKSSDQGGTWAAVNTGLPGTSFYSYRHALAASGTTVYFAFGQIYKTTNGGTSWAAAPGNVEAYQIAVSPQNASVIYALTSSETVEESSDGGTTWSAPATGLPATLQYYDNVNDFVVNPANAQDVFLVASVTTSAFVAKLNNTGSALSWSTFLGEGNFYNNQTSTYGYGVAASGTNVFVTGYTYGQGFPVTNSFELNSEYGAFITEISDATASCSPAFTPATSFASQDGGAISFAIVAPSGCAWTASTNQSWAPVTAGASGTGVGVVTVTPSSNSSGATRSATLTVGSQTATITQPSNACSYSVDQSLYAASTSGGSIPVILTATAGCPWSVTNNYPNAVSVGAPTGTGSGTITLTVARNTGLDPRNFNLTVGNTSISLIQAGTCLSLSASGASTPIGGGAGSVNVIASNPACQWTATSNAFWLTVTSGTNGNTNYQNGTGNGTVTWSSQANGGAARTGVLPIAGLPFTITQGVVSGATTTSLGISGNNPSIFGQNVTLTATVAPAAATGSVTFFNGTTVLGSGVLSNGIARLSTTLLATGTDHLKAQYPGAGNFLSSASAQVSQTVIANPSGTLTQAAGSPIGVGTGPQAVAVGDFNGDGIQDFAIANSGSGNVTILLGNGSGGFSAATGSPFAVGTGPVSVAVWDFNADGIPDLAVANSGSGNVTILLGNGSGGFSAAAGSPFAAGSTPRSVVVGDFNGDGIPDLAAANSGSNNVTVLLGNGSGGFSAATGSPFTVGTGPGSVVIGDFNGDGIPDLATANFNSANVTILLGNGSGGFTVAAGSPFAVGTTFPTSVAVGDFNRDGIQDLAVADFDAVDVLLGNGSGGFSLGGIFAFGTNPYSVAVGDINGDGIQDLVAANAGGNSVLVLLGDGLGGFTAASGSPGAAGTTPYSVAVGDFNGDGRTDLVGANFGSNNVTVLLGGSAATGSVLSTTAPSSVAVGTPIPLTLTVSDSATAFNVPTGAATFLDGATVLGAATQTTSPYTFSATGLGAGSHTLTATYSGDTRSGGSTSNTVTITVGSSTPTPTISSLAPSSARAGGPGFTLTVNGTNFVSGATVDWGATVLTTTFVSATQLTAAVGTAQIATAGPVSVTVVNPGPVTSAAATFTVNSSSVSTITLLSSPSPSTLGQTVTLAANVSPAAATGKVTFYDGTTVLGIGTLSSGVAQFRTDLLASGRGTLKAYYSGNASYTPSTSGPAAQTVNAGPSGTFASAAGSPVGVGTNPQSAAAGDFNGDGIQDLAVVNLGDNTVTVLLGNGSGGFSAATGSPLAVGTSPISVAVGDFNGDRNQDLAVVNAGSNNVTILLGNGSGGFSAATGSPFAAGTTPASLAAGDFNGDGIQDLAIANSGSSNVTVLLGNGSGGFSAAAGSPFAAGTQTLSVAVADFNGDGIPDLVTANGGSNNVTVLVGNGSGGFSAVTGSPFAVGTDPFSVVVGDFNGDGIPDLATANIESGNVTILLGNGSGGFSAATGSPFAVGASPYSIASGDFNGDGTPDLVTADSGGNTVTVLLGTGAGGFSAASSSPFAVGTSPQALAPGDFNGDGKTDLAVVNFGSNNVTILLGGSVATTSMLSTASPASITAGTAVPLSLAVSDTGAAFNAPTGTAKFYDGVTLLGTATQTGSPYTFSATGLAAGSHSLTAIYSGDTRSVTSGSNAINITVTAATSPTISGLSPLSATAGGPAFTLTVSGTNFVSGSTVEWGATALTTTVVSATQLTAPVSAAQIATPGSVSVTVVNPGSVTSAQSAFAILNATGQTWQLLTTSGGPPSVREGSAAVFDASTTQMLVFGGQGAGGTAYLNETWSLNTTTNQWSQLAPGGTPPAARRGVSATYDSVNSIMTIFGGQESESCANDVWTLSNANGSAGTPTWTQLSPAGTPPAARSFGQTVYDPGSNNLIVFGGNNCSLSALYNDVWVLSNANGLGGTPTWTQLAPTGTAPSARNGASAVYDPISNEIILFGGSSGNTDLSDLWILSNANGLGGTPAWTQLTAAGSPIPARGFHSAVYDSASNRMTVFGGLSAIGLGDTWVLTNANHVSGTPTWTQLAPLGTIPPARGAQTAIADPTTNRMIIFGGLNTSFAPLNDTWALSDANNLMPSITQLAPNATTAGGAAFTLMVYGQGFSAGSVVQWNGSALATGFVNPLQLTASVPAGLIASAGLANISVVNPGGATSAPMTFTINAAIPILTITSGGPPNGAVNASYSFTFTGSGGSGNYTWSASGVPGLSVGGSTGVLGGTPSQAGTFTLTVTLTSGASSASQSYAVTITGTPLGITTSSLPNGVENQSYSATLAGSGGSGSYHWAISGIAGLSVDSGSGAISGTPAAGGTLTLNVTLTDAQNAAATAATKAFTVTITFPPLSISGSGALGGFAPGATVSASFTASGGNPPYTWSAAGMPASLSLNAATGQVSGAAPSSSGSYSFSLTVSDTEKPAASASTTVTLSVLGFTTSGTLPSGTTATPYSFSFAATGGKPPYTFTGSGVPAGLSLSGSGLLSGTPASAGTTSFTVVLTDASGAGGVSGSFSLTIASGVQPIQVSGGALPDGSATASYSQTLDAQDGQPTYKWEILGGSLPAGLTLSSAGTISGTPTAAGVATFTARATDTAGGFSAGVFTISINPAPLQITGVTLPSGMAGLPYGSQPINATGGFPPYSFALTEGSLPAPLTFTSGQINGGVPAAAGSSGFTVTVTDAKGNTASQAFTLVIEPLHPDLILSQGSVSFSIVANTATLPAAANVTVGSSVASTLGYGVQTNPAAAWLDVTSGATTPGTVTIGLDAVNAPKLGVGTYQTSVVVTCLVTGGCTGSHSIAVTVNVTVPAPQLSVGTGLLSFSATGNGAPTLAQPLSLENSGGGTVTIQSITAADAWVKLDAAPPITLTAGQTVQVNVTADPTVLAGPGYYQSTITVTSDAGSATVPVTLLIAANATMTLSPAGSQFQTVAGNAPGTSSGSFLVSVSGSGTVNWTAAVVSTSAWLTLNTPSGSSTSASPGTIGFTINGAAASLAALTYYATIEVTATGSSVVDPVQDYEIVLNVAAAGNIGAPNPDPQGLIFLSTGGGTLPAQVVSVLASSTGVSYSAQSDSPSWLSVSPASGTTSSGSPAQSSISVNAAGLGAGVYKGGISYSIAAQVRTVNVTLVVAAAPPAASAISGVTGKASGPACTATKLVPAQTGLVNNFSQPTSWPTPLEITVVDDCGKAVTSGQVVATFSNGDPVLLLTPTGSSSGVYSGTWTPQTTASQVTITAQATAQGFQPATVAITGAVTRGAAPVLNLNGTLNAFIPRLGAPVAPGMIVQIYGSNLAAQTVVSSTIPLTTALNNTSVIIGGKEAPLYFVSPGQINAQVPFELTAGGSYQVIVNANGALSTPNPIQLAGDAPGIAVLPGGGIIAEHGDGSLVTETSPAAPGEYVVFFVSGMGATDNPVASGAPSPASPLAQPTDPPALTLNGVNVPVAFAGLTPTLVGLYQVNFQLPDNMPNGDLQLVLTQSGGQSNSTILPVQN